MGSMEWTYEIHQSSQFTCNWLLWNMQIIGLEPLQGSLERDVAHNPHPSTMHHICSKSCIMRLNVEIRKDTT